MHIMIVTIIVMCVKSVFHIKYIKLKIYKQSISKLWKRDITDGLFFAFNFPNEGFDEILNQQKSFSSSINFWIKSKRISLRKT